MQKILLSIVICTYNRKELLKLCLEHLLSQVKDKETIEVIVVDNNSSDDTRNVVQLKQKIAPSLKYILETQQGLSFARNRGGEEAQGYFIGYIDDDAIVEEHFIANVLHTINEYDFDLFGGRVLPWFRYGQPRWLSNNFESNLSDNSLLEKTEDWGSLWGGVLFVKKEVFLKIGQFHTDLGMGLTMGYGEDTHFVKLAHQAHYQLGVNPTVIIYHLVRKEKLKISWHFRAFYHKGRAIFFILEEEPTGKILVESVLKMVKGLLIGGKKWMFEPNFYWENYLLYAFKPFVFGIGKIVGQNSKSTKK